MLFLYLLLQVNTMKIFWIFIFWVLIYYNASEINTAAIKRLKKSVFNGLNTPKFYEPFSSEAVRIVIRPTNNSTYLSDNDYNGSTVKRQIQGDPSDAGYVDHGNGVEFQHCLIKFIRKYHGSNVSAFYDCLKAESKPESATAQSPELGDLTMNPVLLDSDLQLIDSLKNYTTFNASKSEPENDH